MYFKRLEMFGFKSFADRTKINFERGITAVVGPNGCGKSNIADAVNWVLGEQSAKALRGSRMEDVIFNGTDNKEPLGYAEVSLTLSNESKFLPIEYDEVTISRRLYRSGESEYLINKNPVRLRDVNELLMGSGVGTSSYSMIEQGRIGQILSADPEERRIVFEEASGITRYKSKKKEAIRRLESTEQNLLRVNDIIKEVTRQINSIERQARKARRYRELFDALKDLDTRLAARKYNRMKEKLDAFDNEKSGIKDRGDLLLASLNEFAEELGNLKFQLSLLDEKISRHKRDHIETDTSLRRTKDKIGLDRERLQELHRYQEEQRKEIGSIEKRTAEIGRGINEMSARLAGISEEIRSREELLGAKDEEMALLKSGIEDKDRSIKDNKLRAVDILALQSNIKNEIAKLTSDIQNGASRLRRLNLEKDNVAKEFASLKSGLCEASLSVNMIASKVERLENERISLQNSLKNERHSFLLLEKNINDSKNYILSLHSKLNFLKDLLKRHEGFTEGVQALLNSISDGRLALGAFCEPLADLLEPKKGYEAACEAALREYLQTIVVEDWSTAFTALEFLKDNNLGKAAFIRYMPETPLDPIYQLDNNLILGRLMSFMRFDQRYNALFAHLTGRTFLVNNIEDGISILESLPQHKEAGIKLVTTKGDVIAGNMIIGGSHTQDFTSSVIGRQMRIKETEEEIEECEKELLIRKQELHAKKGLMDDLQARITRVEEAIRAEEIELAQKRSAEENLKKECTKVREEVELVGLEIEEAIAGENELKAKETELRINLEDAAKKEADLQAMIAGAQDFIEEGARKREELLITTTQIQTELAALKRERDECVRQVQVQKNYYDEQLQILNNKKESLDQAFQREGELKEETERLGIDVERLEGHYEIIGNELRIIESERAQLKEVIDKREVEYNKRKEDADIIKDKTHNLEMEKAQLSFQMESLENKIRQIYKLDLRELAPTLEGIDNPDGAQEEVDRLKAVTERMGPVNLVAIDEHKELQERFSFLKRQQEDLVSAKDSLHKAIRKINHTTRSLFLDTFTKVQAEFKNYFRFLFGGGRADIVLLDDSDVLESGIEIIVRPPGKKLQAISLLSGGEKALTAIALLFAIFKIKPSPFCLLDEIDAPLDESNIGRFSKALQEFAKRSQFIIITHNKKTISISDVMYGITMQQFGISKIISVKFAKKKDKDREPVLA